MARKKTAKKAQNNAAEIQGRVSDLRRYNAAYRAGKPVIGDVEYDALIEELRALDPANPWLDQVEPERLRGLKVKHGTPMLSTEKAYGLDKLEDWVERVEKAATEIELSEVEFKVTPKLDGLAGEDTGGILATRGNGRIGTDVTAAFDKGLVAIGGRNQGAGEVVVLQDWFEAHGSDEFDHPRNMCVGIIGADEVSTTGQKALDEGAVRFVPYTTLDTWRGDRTELLETIDEITENLREKSEYALDGMVAEATDSALRKRMGATSHHNRWQIAIKQRGETTTTTVEEVLWQTGRTGNVSPVLRVTPVELSGATIRRITAHHAGMVRDRDLGEGAKIQIIRSGEVIPKLEEVLEEASEVVLPTECPSCGTALDWINEFVNCPNGTDCPAQVESGLRHWFKILGTADSWGPKTIARMVAGGYETLEQLYALTQEEILALNFGEGQTKNLLAALETSRTDLVEDARFLAAFGIKDLGIGDSRKLLAAFPLTGLKTLTAEQLEAVKGFGEVTSPSITRGLGVRWPTVAHMLKLGFNLEVTPLAETLAEVSSPVAGKRVLFTGTMTEASREDMKKQARALGATVASGVSKNLDLLVIGEKPSASKVKKAEEAGVEVLSEPEYLAYLGS